MLPRPPIARPTRKGLQLTEKIQPEKGKRRPFDWAVNIADEKKRPVVRDSLQRTVAAALAIQGSGGVSMTAIADAACRAPATVRRHLKMLEQEGLAVSLGKRKGWKVLPEAPAYAEEFDNRPRGYEVHIGERYGTREVIGEMFLVGSTPYARVRCDCGVEGDVQCWNLKSQKSESCRRCREIRRVASALRHNVDADECKISVRFANGFEVSSEVVA